MQIQKEQDLVQAKEDKVDWKILSIVQRDVSISLTDLKTSIYRSNRDTYFQHLPPPLQKNPKLEKEIAIFVNNFVDHGPANFLAAHLAKTDPQNAFSIYFDAPQNIYRPDELLSTIPLLRIQEEDNNEILEEITQQLLQTSGLSKSLHKYMGQLDIERLMVAREMLVRRGVEVLKRRTMSDFTGGLYSKQLLRKINRLFNRQKLNHGEKVLFCPLCLKYECGAHSDCLPGFARKFQRGADNYQASLTHLHRLLSVKLQQQKTDQSQETAPSNTGQEKNYCSMVCFKRLTISEFEAMHINMFFNKHMYDALERICEMMSFNPCQIAIAFKNKNYSCRSIYVFMMKFLNLKEKGERKLYDSLEEEIMNEAPPQPGKASLYFRKKTSSASRTNRQEESSKPNDIPSEIENSPVEHQPQIKPLHKSKKRKETLYNMGDSFIQPSFCNCRGECGPECPCFESKYCHFNCLCSKDCSIKHAGCKCEKGACKSHSCPCVRHGTQCIPEICGKCHKPGSNCMNNQAIKGQKPGLIAVGKATVCDGMGVFALKDIPKHSFICEYRGEFVTQSVLQIREKANKMLYNFQFIGDGLDATYVGNIGRFINHSQDSNAFTQYRFIGSGYIFGIYAERLIKEGEQILICYSDSKQRGKDHKKYHFQYD